MGGDDGEAADAADFLVVRSLAKPEPEAASKSGDSEEGEAKEKKGAEEEGVAEDADESEEAALPFDSSTFATDLQQVLEGEGRDGLEALARFGIYHKSALVVAVSNLIQEVGDVGAAMAALRARVDHPEVVSSIAPTDDEDEAEPEPAGARGPVLYDPDDY